MHQSCLAIGPPSTVSLSQTRFSKPLANKKSGASAPFFYTPLRKPFRILSKLPAQIKPPSPRKSAHTIYQRCVSSEKNASET